MKEIVVKIEGEDWKSALDKAFKKLNKEAKIDGFRPGKAPKEIFVKKYGMTSLYMEAAQNCINNAYDKMLEKNGDDVIVAEPAVDISAVTDDYIEYKFNLTLRPEVKLGKYKGLNVKKDEVKVTKKEVSESLKAMQERYIENIDKEGTVANNDIAVIDFEGFKDDVAFEGGKGTDYSLKIGSNTFIPGFEEQVIGMKKGETKDIKLSFPKDYHVDELKGQPVVFKVTVKEIKEQKLPELNQDFFDDLGMDGIDSKEALEKQLEDNIKARKEMEAENKYMDDLLKTASKNVEVEIPEEMVNDELDRIVKQYEENLKMQGLTLEMYYKFTNSDEQALREQMKEEATNRIKYRLMLEEIIKAEKIEVTEEEANKEAETLAKNYQMEKEEFLKSFGGLEMVKYDLKMRQAIEVLKK